ncbi:MAG: hypothetical protein J7513_02935 [Solirubrobacteraceae bacterium]|nr:hypothetical protein [Solirubrobacteraceae bacterium]
MRFTSRRRGRLSTLLLSAGAALAVAAPSASAIAPAEVPSIGADTGRFTLPITCDISVPALFNLKVLNLAGTVDIKGIAPVQLAPGQPFYLSQGAGALTLPAWLSSLGGLVTIDKADAVVDNLNIGATGSTPSVINLSKLTDLSVKDIPIKGGQPIVVGLPKTGTFEVGPYKAPNSGVTQLKFLGATANVKLKSTTFGLSLDVRADCKAVTGDASLLSIAVGGAPNSTLVKYTGEPLNFPKAPYNALIGIVNAPYQCSFRGGTYDVGIAVQGTIPLAVSRRGSLPIVSASGALTIPPSTVNKFLDQGFKVLKGNVGKLTLKAQGATPAEPNVVPAAGIAIPPTTLVRDQRLVIPLPATGTLSAGPFTPTATATAVVLGLGSAAATLSFDNETAGTPATCGAPSPDALLVDAPVTP